MDNKFKLLIVDDEEKILSVLSAYLEKEGFEIVTAKDGEAALNIFHSDKIHLVILDLMLPKISGEKVCQSIRASSTVPILMLTAKIEETNKIEGLAIGADDYVTKPFSNRELVSRVKALIRRTYRRDKPLAELLSIDNGALEIDLEKSIVKKHGKTVSLTSNEFRILTVLLSKPNQIFSREQLINKAFGIDYDGFDRTVDTHIKNIRHKLEEDAKNPRYIISVYGMGYKFNS